MRGKKMINEIMHALKTPDYVLPCPFCGSHHISFSDDVERAIWCRMCGATIRLDWPNLDLHDCVSAWNRRAKIMDMIAINDVENILRVEYSSKKYLHRKVWIDGIMRRIKNQARREC